MDGQMSSLRDSLTEVKADASGAAATLRQDLVKFWEDRSNFQHHLQTLKANLEGEAQAVAVAGTIICEQKVEEVKTSLSQERQERQELLVRVNDRIGSMEASIHQLIRRIETKIRSSELELLDAGCELGELGCSEGGSPHERVAKCSTVSSLSTSASSPMLMAGAQLTPGVVIPGSMDFHNHSAHPFVQQAKASPASASASVDFPADRQPGGGTASPHATYVPLSASLDFQVDGQPASCQSKAVHSPNACTFRSLGTGYPPDCPDRKSPPHSCASLSARPELRPASGVLVSAQRARLTLPGSTSPGYELPLPDSRAAVPSSQPMLQLTRDGAADFPAGPMRRASSTCVLAKASESQVSPATQVTAQPQGAVELDERDKLLSEIRQLQQINASLQEEKGARDRILTQQRRVPSSGPQSPPQGLSHAAGPPLAGSGKAAAVGSAGADGGRSGYASPGAAVISTAGLLQISPAGSPSSASGRTIDPQHGSPPIAGAQSQPKVQPGAAWSPWPARMHFPQRGAPQVLADGGLAGVSNPDEAAAVAAAAAVLAAAGRPGQAV